MKATPPKNAELETQNAEKKIPAVVIALALMALGAVVFWVFLCFWLGCLVTQNHH